MGDTDGSVFVFQRYDGLGERDERGRSHEFGWREECGWKRGGTGVWVGDGNGDSRGRGSGFAVGGDITFRTFGGA